MAVAARAAGVEVESECVCVVESECVCVVHGWRCRVKVGRWWDEFLK